LSTSLINDVIQTQFLNTYLVSKCQLVSVEPKLTPHSASSESRGELYPRGNDKYLGRAVWTKYRPQIW